MQGVVGCLIGIAHIACIIITGMLAWEWIEPASFWEVLKFLFVWGILETIAASVLQLIYAVLYDLTD